MRRPSKSDVCLSPFAEAQHVVLVEPLLDPAVEAQAVGRVDRIGQKRSTHVHRWGGTLGSGAGWAIWGVNFAGRRALRLPLALSRAAGPCVIASYPLEVFCVLPRRPSSLRFVVERTIEENVHRLCQQRAAAMDLSAASGACPHLVCLAARCLPGWRARRLAAAGTLASRSRRQLCRGSVQLACSSRDLALCPGDWVSLATPAPPGGAVVTPAPPCPTLPLAPRPCSQALGGQQGAGGADSAGRGPAAAPA